MTTQLPKVLITGASTGIGATYADRFARRGHDLVLVARDESRMRALANRLQRETSVGIEIVKADLTSPADLARVESRLRDDERIGVLVNNAGIAAHGSFANPDLEAIENLLAPQRYRADAPDRGRRAALPATRRRRDRQYRLGSRARSRVPAGRLRRNEVVCPGALAEPAERARPARHLRAGSASCRYAHGDLGAVRP